MTEPKRSPEPAEAPPRDPVDEAVEESFPASDPPSYEPLHSGTPERHRAGEPSQGDVPRGADGR